MCRPPECDPSRQLPNSNDCQARKTPLTAHGVCLLRTRPPSSDVSFRPPADGDLRRSLKFARQVGSRRIGPPGGAIDVTHELPTPSALRDGEAGWIANRRKGKTTAPPALVAGVKEAGGRAS